MASKLIPTGNNGETKLGANQRATTKKKVTNVFSPSKGKALWKSGALKAANLGFSERISRNSSDPRALRGAGLTAFKENKWEEARKYLQRVVDLTDEEWDAAGEKNKKEDMIDSKLLRARTCTLACCFTCSCRYFLRS